MAGISINVHGGHGHGRKRRGGGGRRGIPIVGGLIRKLKRGGRGRRRH